MFDPNKEKEKQQFLAGGGKFQMQNIPGFQNINSQSQNNNRFQNGFQQPTSLGTLQFPTIDMMLNKNKDEKKFNFSNGVQSIDTNSGLGSSLNFNSQTDNQSGSMF